MNPSAQKPIGVITVGLGISGGLLLLLVHSDVLLAIGLIAGIAAFCAFVFLGFQRRLYRWLALLSFGLAGVNLVGADPSDILFPLLLALGFLAGYLRPKGLRLSVLLDLCLVGFVVFYFVSVFLGQPDWRHVAHLISKLSLLYFIRLFVNSGSDLRQLMASFLGGLVASACLGFAAAQGVLSWELLFPSLPDARFRGLAGDPNYLAIFSVLGLLWLLDETLQPKLWTRYRPVKFLLLILLSLGIVFSLSRGAWLNLAVALAAYAALKVRKLRFQRFAHAFGILAATGVVTALVITQFSYGGYVYKDWLTSRFEIQEGEFDRFRYAERGLELAADNFFGYGPGQNEALLGATPHLIGAHFPHRGAHNMFVQVLVDNGWVCFAALVFLLGFVGLALLRRALEKEEGPLGLSSSVVFAAFAGVAVNALVIDMFYTRIFWFVLGLAWITAWPPREPIVRPVHATSSGHSTNCATRRVQ